MENIEYIHVPNLFVVAPEGIITLLNGENKFDDVRNIFRQETDVGQKIIIRHFIMCHQFDLFKFTINLLDDKNITFDDNILLKTAVYFGSDTGDPMEIIKYLVENGADITASDNLCLKIAIINNNLPVVKLLVEFGVDVRVGNNYAIRCASYDEANLYMVRYLVENGADIHTNNDYPFRVVVYNEEDLEIIKYLVDSGADIHADNDFAIRSAVRFGYEDICQYLLEQGCSINILSKDELNGALKSASYNIIKLLVDNGVDFSYLNDEKIKVKKNNEEEIIKLLSTKYVDKNKLYSFYLNNS